jgi:hypothetical protein
LMIPGSFNFQSLFWIELLISERVKTIPSYFSRCSIIVLNISGKVDQKHQLFSGLWT